MRAGIAIRAGLCAAVVASIAAYARAATTWAAASTTPRYLYVSNLTDGTINTFGIDGTSGRLRPRAYVITGAQPCTLVADPLGKCLVAGTFGSANQLLSYTLGADGTATLAQTGTPYAGPNDGAFSNDGARLFWPNLDQNYVTKYDYSTATGAFTNPGTVNSAGTWPESVVMHPTLAVCYVPNYITNDVYTYDIGAGGTLTENVAARRSLTPGAPGPIAMAVSPNGQYAYVACYDTSQIFVFQVNTGTGVLTQQAVVTNANMVNPTSIGVDDSSRFVYTANDGSNKVSYWRISNTTTGAITHNTSYAAGSNPSRLSLDPSGKFLYCLNRTSNNLTAYSIDTGTGSTRGRLTTLGTYRTHRGPYAVAVAAGSAAVTYTPKYAYVTNSDDNNLSVYTVNASTGVLTAASPATTTSGGSQPLYMQVHPTGKYLYVINRDDPGTGQRGLQAWSINASTGALTAVGSLVATDAGPRRFAIEPTGRFLYVAHDTAQTIGVYSINQSTGALTRLSGSTVNVATTVWGISCDPSGLYVLLPDRTANTTRAYAINLTTGALTLASTSGAQGSDPRCVDCDPTAGFVYTCNLASPDTSAYTFNSAATWGSLGTLDSGGSQCIQIACEPQGKWCYTANFGSNDVSQFTIGATGTLSNPQTTGAGTAPQGLTVDPSGKFLYVPNSGSNNVSAFTINATDGTLNSVSGSPFTSGRRPHTVIIMGTVQ